ncbi:MAG: outer membrane beta-barrel protein [Pseudolabrys sp.]
MYSFATLRGRLGPVFGGTLLYAAGGAHAFDTSAAGAGGTKWRTGWTVGGRIEQQLSGHWSAKLEYLYMDFDNHRFRHHPQPYAGRNQPDGERHPRGTQLQLLRAGAASSA